MKICIITTSADSIISFREQLIKNILLKDNEIYILAPKYSNKIKNHLKLLGVTPINCSLNRAGLNPFIDIFSTIRLAIKIKQLSPDIVFSYFPKAVIFGTLAAKLARTPRTVGMLEGLGYTFTFFSAKRLEKLKKYVTQLIQVSLYRISFTFLDRIVFLNPDDLTELIGKHRIKPKDYKILGGIGVNLDDYLYMPPVIKPVSFIFIGRLLRDKGIFEFIDAAALVKKQHPEVKFIILGAIDKHNPSGIKEAEINRLLKDNTIIYPGHVNNVQEWINNSSVFVLPSYREGVPRSTQEAMAIGRPIITTDVPGCRETVENGVNGFLVPPQNIEELARKMIFFIENPEQITLMGKKSREIAEKEFCAKKQAKKLYDLIVND